ncbi:MAG: glutaminyl-peptide cyclotransferase [Candidatus Microthrix sp.]|nr:glutaminyl-peptide cyclotransferase [Candidatus Microthrix sp.]
MRAGRRPLSSRAWIISPRAPTGCTRPRTARAWPVVERRLPHDPEAFTQGLEVVDGEVIESTGLYGESSVRRWTSTPGERSTRSMSRREFFAEG